MLIPRVIGMPRHGKEYFSKNIFHKFLKSIYYYVLNNLCNNIFFLRTFITKNTKLLIYVYRTLNSNVI